MKTNGQSFPSSLWDDDMTKGNVNEKKMENFCISIMSSSIVNTFSFAEFESVGY